MSQLINREVILAKIESTYNTDSVPVVGTDAVLAENPSPSFEGLRLAARNPVQSSLTTVQQVYGGALMALEFDVEVKGSGAAGTAPEIGPLLRSCGLAETLVASTSSTYAPASSSLESCTIYYFEDGKRHVLTGCRGNVSFSLVTGDVPKAHFRMVGHWAGPTDVAAGAQTYDSTVPAAVLNGTFTIGGTTLTINELTFDMQTALGLPADFNAADGYGEVSITKRDVMGTMDPEAVLIAVEPIFADFKAGNKLALATGNIGATAGNILNITCPGIYYRDVGFGDREATRINDIPFGCAESSGDDEISIAFT